MVTIGFYRDLSVIRPVLFTRGPLVCQRMDRIMLGTELVGSVSTGEGQDKFR